MTGWKTWVAGAIAILGGLLAIAQMLMGEASGTGISDAITMIAGGLGMIGIGHKIEKAAA